uniref:dUTPase-like domain-containing protein n=1 Tax=Malurus cyaneus samueli TaxID=2593467 RepID=A0A8C5U7U0_9PASS
TAPGRQTSSTLSANPSKGRRHPFAGKRNEPRGERGYETELSNHGGCLDHMFAATSGSAGIDLVTAESCTVKDVGVNIIPTTTNGPLGYGLSALLIGRSSATKQGIFVQPGLIDSDFCGQIKIMVRVLAPPIFIPKGSVIAQLVPFKSEVPNSRKDIKRQDGGFGSTGPLCGYLSGRYHWKNWSTCANWLKSKSSKDI